MSNKQIMVVRSDVLPEWDYALMVYDNLFSQDGNPLCVHFVIEHHQEQWITGAVDWQDGVHIWQSEGIEPELWSTGMGVALQAIKEARKMIGSTWDCREPM